MGAIAKLKNNGRANSAVAVRVKSAKTAAKSEELPESYTDKVRRGGGRTKLAEDAGVLFERILDFAEKHELPRGLKRRLDNCTDALWDLEMEEDAKSGALERGYGTIARSSGKSIPLEEALEKMKSRR